VVIIGNGYQWKWLLLWKVIIVESVEKGTEKEAPQTEGAGVTGTKENKMNVAGNRA